MNVANVYLHSMLTLDEEEADKLDLWLREELALEQLEDT